ncbi:uncharacterized protein LAJ45_10240 [Morchella importuna]|uniref:uncharacterized protein n=1 Tax=Morchella importuna TaxID=1174673 RepID=UPI001E8E966A|nr:uncharacterized protein LAJ45_10240 [Morchella importuna]KAH8145763.1 hypothetical protein LAJ45_10240 [Morchella importuna]
MASAPTASTAPPNLDRDFYNPHLSVSLNPRTHLFIYNFGSPPRLRKPLRPRRSLEPVPMVPRRPGLLVQRMTAMQLRETYNPYLKYREDTWMAEMEWRRYKLLRSEVEGEVEGEGEVGRAEVERYVQVLRERGRREEEREDGRRAVALLGKVQTRAGKGVGGGGQGSRGGLGKGGIVDNGRADFAE